MPLDSRVFLAPVLAMSLVALTGCDRADNVQLPQPAEETQTQVDPREAILKAQQDRIAALNSGDVDGAVAIYAPDATLVTPGRPPITDAAAIRANYASLLGDDAVRLTVQPGRLWVSAGADFAVTTSRIVVDGSDGDQRSKLESANQAVWQRQPDGSWKIASEYNLALPRDDAADAADPMDSGATEIDAPSN